MKRNGSARRGLRGSWERYKRTLRGTTETDPTRACSGRAIGLSLMQGLNLPAVRARR